VDLNDLVAGLSGHELHSTNDVVTIVESASLKDGVLVVTTSASYRYLTSHIKTRPAFLQRECASWTPTERIPVGQVHILSEDEIGNLPETDKSLVATAGKLRIFRPRGLPIEPGVYHRGILADGENCSYCKRPGGK